MPTEIHDDPSQFEEMLVAFFEEIDRHGIFHCDPARLETGKKLCELPVRQRVLLLRFLFAQMALSRWPRTPTSYSDAEAIRILISKLLRAALPLTESDLDALLANTIAGRFAGERAPIAAILRAAEQYQSVQPLSDRHRQHLIALRSKIETQIDRSYQRELKQETVSCFSRIDALLNAAVPRSQAIAAITIEEPWAAAAPQDLKALPAPLQERWNPLLLHLQSARASAPSQKWLDRAASLIDAFDRRAFRYFVISWLPIAAKQAKMFSAESQNILKGFVWAASCLPEPDVTAVLGDLGEVCWKKIPGHGACSQLVGNAVFRALAAIGTDHAVAQLSRINVKLKRRSARRLADSAMNRVAEATGQTRDDLEELSVPTFGLASNGTRSQTLGSFTVTLSISPAHDVRLAIADGNGKLRKSVPTAIKAEHSTKFREIQKTIRQLKSILSTQKLRVESLIRNVVRRWSLADWRSRYLDHPVLSPLTRRLIWRFTSTAETLTAMPLHGGFQTAAGPTIAPNDAKFTVQLWHPCTSSLDEVRAWRTFLETREITQPFKQAHREIYLLTDAERRTEIYSNRFAAHVIRQHQFNALCAHRGWQYKLQGSWDGGNPTPTLDLPALNLKVEFWVEPIGLQDPEGIASSGVALNLATDQVRFYRRQPREQIPLEQVPPQVFSEILRDIDLFVGVCSVGNDPTWSDGGPNGRYQTYWHSYSFGALNESANTRKAVLETLIPRLKIASQCSLTDKFLRVQGSLRAYKIHLGSGNILMEPNDQYLCIVPNQSAKSGPTNLFLPFEGDNTLSIILSKAFLLANDTKISDPTITRQIKS